MGKTTFIKEIAHQQINSAINACEARIECGMDTRQAFRDLEQEILYIMGGGILYEE